MGIIKTQFLASAGGGNTLSINVDTGSLVTITNGDIQKQATSVNGVAKFKNIKAGTWSVQATLSGQEANGQVIVTDDYSLSLSYGTKLSTLPKGTIVKYQDIVLKVICHNHAGYPSGCTTLWVKSYTTTSGWGSAMTYSAAGCSLRSKIETWASSCSLAGKMLNTTIIVNVSGESEKNYTAIKAYAISVAELGEGITEDGSNLGFSDRTDVVSFFQLARNVRTRSTYADTRQYAITPAGAPNIAAASDSYVPLVLCNLSGTETCEDNGDGTYTLKES